VGPVVEKSCASAKLPPEPALRIDSDSTPPYLRVMRKVIVVWLWLGCACASSQDALIQRRNAMRAQAEEAANLELDAYRSAEEVRGTRWGMTMAEVIAAKGEPDQQTADACMYVDLVDEAKAPTVYAFLEGHLAQVTSQLTPEALGQDAIEKAMMLKYGAPTSYFDKASELAPARDDRADVAFAVLGGVALALSPGQLLNPFTWVSLFRNDGQRRALELQAKPARDVRWATRETQVRWVKLDSGISTISWTSAMLVKRLAARRDSAAGLQAAGKDL